MRHDIKQDSEFKNLMPLLSADAFEQLERNILEHGIRDALVIWNDLILDGHNRYAIAQKHGLDFEIKIIDLPSRDTALMWIVKNQLGRRNLTSQQISYLRGKQYEQEKKQHGVRGKTKIERGGTLPPLSNTAEKVASEHNINSSTIKRDARYSRAVDKITQIAGPEAKTIIFGTEAPLTKKDVIEIAEIVNDAPDLVVDVVRGKVDAKKAIKEVRMRKREKEPEIVPLPALKSPRLIVGKAEESGLDDNSIDLIVTSPPYNLGQDNWPMGGSGREPRKDGIGYQDDMNESMYQKWQLDCLAEMYRVAKQGASLFYNHKVRNRKGYAIHPLKWLLDDNCEWILRQEIIWDRGSTHNHSPSLFWPEDERVYWMTKGKPTLPDRPVGMSTIWRFHGPVASTWHPAPFCDELPKRCIKAVGREGIVVLDPFAGSCTTLKIALSYGYDSIGVDINKEYLKKASLENGWILENLT